MAREITELHAEPAPDDAGGVLIHGKVTFEGKEKFFATLAPSVDVLKDPKWWADFEEQMMWVFR